MPFTHFDHSLSNGYCLQQEPFAYIFPADKAFQTLLSQQHDHQIDTLTNNSKTEPVFWRLFFTFSLRCIKTLENHIMPADCGFWNNWELGSNRPFSESLIYHCHFCIRWTQFQIGIGWRITNCIFFSHPGLLFSNGIFHNALVTFARTRTLTCNFIAFGATVLMGTK